MSQANLPSPSVSAGADAPSPMEESPNLDSRVTTPSQTQTSPDIHATNSLPSPTQRSRHRSSSSSSSGGGVGGGAALIPVVHQAGLTPVALPSPLPFTPVSPSASSSSPSSCLPPSASAVAASQPMADVPVAAAPPSSASSSRGGSAPLSLQPSRLLAQSGHQHLSAAMTHLYQLLAAYQQLSDVSGEVLIAGAANRAVSDATDRRIADGIENQRRAMLDRLQALHAVILELSSRDRGGSAAEADDADIAQLTKQRDELRLAVRAGNADVQQLLSLLHSLHRDLTLFSNPQQQPHLRTRPFVSAAEAAKRQQQQQQATAAAAAGVGDRGGGQRAPPPPPSAERWQ